MFFLIVTRITINANVVFTKVPQCMVIGDLLMAAVGKAAAKAGGSLRLAFRPLPRRPIQGSVAQIPTLSAQKRFTNSGDISNGQELARVNKEK